MKAYLRSVVAGLVAATLVTAAAWGAGVGPRVTQKVFPPPPVQSTPARGDAAELSVAVGPITETGYVFPRPEQAAVLLAFLGGVAWSVRRDRHQSKVV